MTSPAAAPLLTVRDLRVHFDMGRGLFSRHQDTIRAIDGVSFDLGAGETLGIVGESGCGKSTLGRAVLRLIEPRGGQVIWMGEDLGRLARAQMQQRRADMQIIFQDPLASLDPRMTVGDIIAEPLITHNRGMKKTAVRNQVGSWMERVGLTAEMINRYPHEFSGGQAQRIGIARAMILGPKLIICDEPVSALDVSIQAQIINLLGELQREFGLSLIFISHDLSVVRHISNRVMVLYLGKVMEMADRDSLYAQPRHPYTRALISAVPIPDPDREREKERIVLSGDLPSPIDPPSGCPFRTRCPLVSDVCGQSMPVLAEEAPGHVVACHNL